MTLKGRARSTTRRIALQGAGTRLRVTGQAARIWNQPHGLAILLLHNTMGRDADALISYVERHRERFTDFDDVEDLVASRESRIALSFDDGFRSNLDVARRLHALGVKACFYVPTDAIGLQQTAVDNFFGRPQAEGVLTWNDLEEIVALGHHVGSHCRQHRPLIDQSPSQAEDQVKGSLEELRRRLGQARHFAWPFGTLRHADAGKVVAWCAEVHALAASGVRGFNTPERLATDGYLRRDAVDLQWIDTDTNVFLDRDAKKSARPTP